MIRYANYWTAINDTVLSNADTLTYNCFAQYCNVCSDHYKVKVPESWFYTHYPCTGDGVVHMVMYSMKWFQNICANVITYIDVTPLPQGIYLLELTDTTGHRTVSRLVKH